MAEKKNFKEKNIKYVRELFRTRFGLTDFAGNYPNSNKFKKSNWLCKCGIEKEQESHIIEGKCESYEDIRNKYDDFENDESLLEYFKEVIQRREKLEEEERSCLLAGGEPTTPPILLVPAQPGTSQHGDSDVQLVADH